VGNEIADEKKSKKSGRPWGTTIMNGIIKGFVAVVVLTAAGVAAQAQVVNLNFGIKNSVLNEFDQVLPGVPSEPGALVQILVGNQGRFPPSTNGAAHVNNTVLRESRIGIGVDPAIGPVGKASDVISVSRSVTNAIFARIFNAPTKEAASFYTDSQLYNVPIFGQTYGIFWVEAAKTTNEIDTTDHDGDGLSRSWEMSYGTDAANPDTDNDGMNDGNEILAGTDALDEESLLMMVELNRAPGGNLLVTWDSVVDKTYQLEFTTNSLLDVVAFSPINGPVTATGNNASTVVTNGTVPETSNFRVRLVLPGE
jgi:Bacterial TSP3 repeat